ncbi:hypothetical protein [Bordetella genomosp. 9]|uniref:hypothetical protein n=1 Tax=Bordetella genomosp. 9 TaxID=1416803 RepID=UPI0012F9132D|nr:hypothetical protein [Bordetella genomosp. 9]
MFYVAVSGRSQAGFLATDDGRVVLDVRYAKPFRTFDEADSAAKGLRIGCYAVLRSA